MTANHPIDDLRCGVGGRCRLIGLRHPNPPDEPIITQEPAYGCSSCSAPETPKEEAPTRGLQPAAIADAIKNKDFPMRGTLWQSKACTRR